ncbi:VanZ family protein [Mucilaginibacter sp. BT774]|uniref:VanZ family protein n=1 Tax=Mucilaginibacter sp. BT774 TaxID=3062276 RepID=UPI002676A6E5|nr:VanZ family protein [Mucilaginibacter sp. BT774]MDO3627051.1 VanZ family protein [Mucilaginibacter sp. BT774]
MMKLSKYQRPTVLWALFIFIMCSIKIGDNIAHGPLFFPGFDKLVHSGFFFLLVVFWCNGIIRQQNNRLVSYKTAAIVTFISILFGGLIELLQLTFFTWRSGEWPDLFADAAGACMGILGVMIIDRAKKL